MAASPPFRLVLRGTDVTSMGQFLPQAAVELTPHLRTSGLLDTLPADDLRLLLLILTFVHPNGFVQPTVQELASTLRLSPARTRKRLCRLEHFRWQDKPLVMELRRESGLHAWTPSPRLLATATEPLPKPVQQEPLPYRAAGREAIVAHSRAAYARPREEVEREIAALNGWDWPPRTVAQAYEELIQPTAGTPNDNLIPPAMPPMLSSLAADLSRELQALGVPRDIADRLVTRFDAETIRCQIRWLPFRHAHSPARFLVAAIEGDYAPPRSLPEERFHSGDNTNEEAHSAETPLPLP
jgi:hypothetical protein